MKKLIKAAESEIRPSSEYGLIALYYSSNCIGYLVSYKYPVVVQFDPTYNKYKKYSPLVLNIQQAEKLIRRLDSIIRNSSEFVFVDKNQVVLKYANFNDPVQGFVGRGAGSFVYHSMYTENLIDSNQITAEFVSLDECYYVADAFNYLENNVYGTLEEIIPDGRDFIKFMDDHPYLWFELQKISGFMQTLIDEGPDAFYEYLQEKIDERESKIKENQKYYFTQEELDQYKR